MEDNIVIPLSPLDNVMARCYTKYLLCFTLRSGQTFQHVNSILQRGLSMSIARWPIYGGAVGLREPNSKNWKPGQMEVRIPTQERIDTLFTLVFNDLSSEKDFAELKDSGFPEEQLDGTKLLSGAYKLDLKSGLDVTVAQANFLFGGCLLGLGIWHCVSDAYGAYNLLESWSENCRKIQKEQDMVGLGSGIQESLDREILTKIWVKERSRNFSAAEFMTAEGSWRFLGLNPPSENTGEQAKKVVPAFGPPQTLGAMKTCVFYVSGDSFAALKHATTVDDRKISGNDAISAFLWRSIMNARFPERGVADQASMTYLDVLLDGRSQFSSSLPTSYLGNVVFFATVSHTLSTLTAPSTTMSHIARTVREALNTYSKIMMHEAFDVAQSLPDFTQISHSFAGFDEAKMNITSTLNIPLFQLSFGEVFGNNGHADSIRILKDELDGMFRRCLVLPLRKHGGFEIIISLFQDELQRLMADDEFSRYAEFSCY